MLVYKTQKLAYLFPSKASIEFTPLICFLLDMLLGIHKNYFDFHYKNHTNRVKEASYSLQNINKPAKIIFFICLLIKCCIWY